MHTIIIQLLNICLKNQNNEQQHTVVRYFDFLKQWLALLFIYTKVPIAQAVSYSARHYAGDAQAMRAHGRITVSSSVETLSYVSRTRTPVTDRRLTTDSSNRAELPEMTFLSSGERLPPLERSTTAPPRINIYSNFFHRRVATPF